MSEIMDVIRNKNRIQKQQRERQKQNLTQLKNEQAFRAALYEELKKVGVILDDADVSEVVITVPDRFIAKFTGAILDIPEFEIIQVEGESNKFIIRDKFVNL